VNTVPVLKKFISLFPRVFHRTVFWECQFQSTSALCYSPKCT